MTARTLARRLGPSHYFALGFGTIIGAGWVIVLGSWLELAGPGGALVAFAIGGLLVAVVGLCYGEMATLLPVAGGEVAYAYEFFGLRPAFAIGWALSLVWVVFTAFEAISFAIVAAQLLPGLAGQPLYTLLGQPVTSGGLVLGLGGMLGFAWLHYRGPKTAAWLQNVLTGLLVVFSAIFVVAGIVRGSVANLLPAFEPAGAESFWSGFVAVLLTTPAWYAGFNVIPQAMEERASRTPLRLVGRMIVSSIAAAAVFYVAVILAAGMIAPWRETIGTALPAASAFEAALGSPWLADLVLLCALLGLITTWNAVYLAGTRLLFALARAWVIPPVLSRVHPRFGTPSRAVLFVGCCGALAVFLGRGAILPLLNLGATCFGLGYLVTCYAVIKARRVLPGRERPYPVPGGTTTAWVAAALSAVFLLLSLYQPWTTRTGPIPLEWALLAGWAALGAGAWQVGRHPRQAFPEASRRALMLGLESDASPAPAGQAREAR